LLGISWEDMIKWHVILGITFVLLIIVHIVSWLVLYNQAGLPSRASSRFPLPLTPSLACGR
jgi:cytochrome bd-type quinol oxidase subunit 2